jgi:Ca2+-binding EF-hand superfamily protein
VRIGALLLGAVAFSYCGVSGGIPPALPGSARDVQDLVFLSDARPILLRLHIYVDGRPFRDVWQDYIRVLFDYLDRDGNGILTKSEAEQAPSAAQLLQMMRGAILPEPTMKAVTFGELDVDLHGFVTFGEFAGYYRRSGAGPLQVADGPAIERREALTRALFKHLDANRDGKLSQAEILGAESVLRRFDLDDDEMISEEELLPVSVAMPTPRPEGPMREQAPSYVANLHVLDQDRTAAGLAQRLLQKYDKEKKGSLSAAELGLAQALFDRLDADHDGQLDETELGKFAGLPPDIEITIRTGEPASGQRSVEVYDSRQRSKLPPAICLIGSETLLITLADEQIGVVVPPERPELLPQARSVRQFYVQQFRAADTENKGYVERARAMKPEHRFLFSIFPLADRDGDEKLTQAELNAFLDLQQRAAFCATGLELTSSGRGLFEILDANRDRRLGQRELRSAWSRLAIWDRNGDGLIAPKELPQQFQLVLGRGQPFRRAGRLGGDVASAHGASVKAPLWFRKMDKNGDGDLSPREFLGTPEDFRRIDTNGDGLIDPQEAEAADRWFAKRLPTRR